MQNKMRNGPFKSHLFSDSTQTEQIPSGDPAGTPSTNTRLIYRGRTKGSPRRRAAVWDQHRAALINTKRTSGPPRYIVYIHQRLATSIIVFH